MYDRPTAAELLQAARQHLEAQVLPVARQTNFKLYFQTLVANNVLKIVEREVTLRETHLRAEWARLNMLLASDPLPQTLEALDSRLAQRNATLCHDIRAGEWDDSRAMLEHLRATATEQLEVANPKFLKTLAAEDAALSADDSPTDQKA